MQEFCGSRALAVCSEDDARQCPYTEEEEAEFSEMRRGIKSGMKTALPLWGQRLVDSSAASASSKTAQERKEAQIHGVEAFAKAQAKVTCQEPVDKIRALLPIFLNSPVQDASELRDLVTICVRLVMEGAMSEEAKTTIIDAQQLVEFSAARS
jgi:hypothetical protein